MEFNVGLYLQGKLSFKEKREALEKLSKKALEILKDKIEDVYEINERFHPERNYVPLEEMLSVVSVQYSVSPASITVYLDETAIRWRDYKNKPIYEIAGPGEDYYSIQGKTVTSLDKHWKTPIEGKKEDTWFFDEATAEIWNYIITDFSQELQKISSGGGYRR